MSVSDVFCEGGCPVDGTAAVMGACELEVERLSVDWGSAVLSRSSDVWLRINAFLPRLDGVFPFHSAEELELSCVCRSLVNRCRETVIKLQCRVPSESSASWRTVQFSVEDPSHFVMVVQLEGTWNAKDVFRMGIAPKSVSLDGEQGWRCGLWFSPKSGRLMGEDGSKCMVPVLEVDGDGFAAGGGDPNAAL